jgi:hypothetical protein
MTRLTSTVVLVVVLLAPASAQNGNSAWVSWARANHHPIASVQTVEGDTFADLQFFKTVLTNRRIVQLGESGHGVAGVGADDDAFVHLRRVAHRGSSRAVRLHRRDPANGRPLILAGFDTQMSSRVGTVTRPAFFANMVRHIDPQRATSVQTDDDMFISGISASGGPYAIANEARLTDDPSEEGGRQQLDVESTVQRDWGVNAFRMIPRNQYDGVLFVDAVRAPSYLSFN